MKKLFNFIYILTITFVGVGGGILLPWFLNIANVKENVAKAMIVYNQNETEIIEIIIDDRFYRIREIMGGSYRSEYKEKKINNQGHKSLTKQQ